MSIFAPISIIIFIVLIAVCAGLIWLEFRLSRSSSRWLGLILPAITLLLSLIAAIGVLTFAIPDSNGYWPIALNAFIAFLVYNIPTLVLAGIYLHERDKIKRREELARMNVQDL
ncbi:hypothetical protein D2E25_1021 [Bifidobacterium goeldii]|uniref:Uncharacterized protein n=1 Tax=Bifidobacterium goeldii TaxID=2306975 RepID=A0A430FJZ6_9BIFI|nr:hypothetical protein [Bifidobacterium goeldii]RSX53048.1 hypothetical protein D2E25_1021 [Bifidobacterium goeldii]